MAYAPTPTVGRVMRRADGFGYDWIVSDGSSLFDGADGIELQSPFFNCLDYGGEWKISLHHRKNAFISVYVANKECVGKGGYKLNVGLVDKDGKDFCLDSDQTTENGMIVINSEKDKNWFSDYERICRGRLIVYCKFSA